MTNLSAYIYYYFVKPESKNGPRYDGNPDQTTPTFKKTHSDPNRIDDLGSPRKSMDIDLDKGNFLNYDLKSSKLFKLFIRDLP